MPLDKKEIEYFADQLPQGQKVVDLEGVQNYKDFVEKYCPPGNRSLPYSVQVKKAVENFLKIYR